MKSYIALSFAAAAVALPQSSTPAGCSPSTEGSFQITTVNVTSPTKRSVVKRQLDGPLTMKLQDGILTDQAGRTGYIASNYQFQFDAPVQADARETSGFGLCGNSSLSLGGTTVFYQCLSGEFYNLYSQSTGAQCIPIHIQAVNRGDSTVSQIPDGQPQASSAGAPAVTQISDGQPQATEPGAPVVTQISDGQPQASSPAVVTQIPDGQPQASAPAVVTQISDGQPQASAPAVVTQISDGQPQASAPAVVTQISDGQPQASAPAVVTQISDGQPQASAPAPVVTQISDGQPQASAPAAPIGNISTNGTTPPLSEFTGAASATNAASIGGFAAGLFALFALL